MFKLSSRILLAGTSLLAATSVTSASATVINSLPGGTAVTMPAFQSFTAGPTSFGPITYSSTSSSSVIGWTAGYGFSTNGSWSGEPAMAGVNTPSDTMTFTFADAVSAVLADINWAPGGSNGLPITASIFDSSSALLETIVFSADGSSNDLAPGYWGFSRNSADIKSLTLSNGYIGARSFSYLGDAGAVPEPATWALMIGGFGMVGGAMRYRRGRRAVSFA